MQSIRIKPINNQKKSKQNVRERLKSLFQFRNKHGKYHKAGILNNFLAFAAVYERIRARFLGKPRGLALFGIENAEIISLHPSTIKNSELLGKPIQFGGNYAC